MRKEAPIKHSQMLKFMATRQDRKWERLALVRDYAVHTSYSSNAQLMQARWIVTDLSACNLSCVDDDFDDPGSPLRRGTTISGQVFPALLANITRSVPQFILHHMRFRTIADIDIFNNSRHGIRS
jgi:hypothetical protein